ncbi:HAD family phosphatase [Nitratireductor sp. ZSWI3]|uniref:HAD family hydrolase n=1 Tax=Nitratireductor sp. ZSWI3 TaxID=2966359 RepID=UPI00215003A9|nr:HAD-IA family hydrolase [Nitratireductor sp. ZSWI3]MCR4268313.1 HAD-IA family hydrolase [Nitratireductor sp. ZSWI3]
MTKPPFDLVIFDCDGVLIDSEPIASRTMAETLTRVGFPMSADAVLQRFTGKSESDIRLDLAARGLQDFDSFAGAWHEHLYTAFATDLKPMPGIEAVVLALDSPVCVASNSSRIRLERSLGGTSLWPLFAPNVFSAEDVAHPKPAPDLVLHCLSRCRARAERSVMIDDSIHGISAALAAGVMPIGFVDPGDPRPDRQARLREAGAAVVATGAAELADVLGTLSPVG